MPFLTAGEIAEVCSGRLIGDGSATVSTIVADSRESFDGAGFVAVRSGHSFVADAFAGGAGLAIVERAECLPDGATGVVVEDVVHALARLSAHVRSRLRAQVVGITGSVGKTLTKDFTAAAVSPRHRVHASPRSFNTEVGVPLSILSCPDDADVLVLEMGARHPGEISELAEIARCQIGVVTGIGKTHIGEFGSRATIARTKAELLDALPADGLAVVPADDEFLPLLAATATARTTTVGPGGTVRFRADRVELPGRTVGVVSLDSSVVEVVLPVPGRALMRNAAIALGVARELEVDAETAAAAIARCTPSSSRMEVSSLGGWTLVNDAYNANPSSTASALRTVRELASSAPLWAVLGEMAELGSIADSEHARIGRLVAALGYTGVVVVGERADALAEAAGSIAVRVATNDEAADVAIDRVPSGAYLLVKGSLVTGLKGFGEILTTKLARARAGIE
jgi:UDP-N-acetylmuramoyl-tripeptide--D-alanyl-D-alanine ligase